MTAPAAQQPLLDLPGLALAVRRRRRWWLSAALLGLAAGALLAVLAPPPPTAVSTLLIVHEQDHPTDAGTLIKTDVALLETTRLAAAALQRLGSTDRPEDFLETYEAEGLTNNVLELRVEGDSDADAVARAQALADVFIADHVQRVRAAAEADATALIAQRDKAQAELNQVDAAIAAAVPPDPDEDDRNQAERDRAAAQLEQLYARRAELTAQIHDLGRRAEEAGIGAPRVAAGTQIVDAPRALPASPLRTGVTNAAVGFLLGLAGGLAVATVAGVVRDRPVLRRDIAAHLGASVIAQLPGVRRRLTPPWRRSRRAAERKRVAATLVRIAGTGPVSVLELGCPQTAAQLAADMAAEFVEGQHRIGVGSVGPATAWTDLESLGSQAVLVVRAGHADTAWLHTVARQLADLRIPVIGVVLVDPDPRDRSDGTLWDAVHTALRGRVHWPAYDPDRPSLNGTASAVPAGDRAAPFGRHRAEDLDN